jgi:glycosyltransferase involved in cell wall biosynthesis
VRVLSVGNMYPPHHLGGYELMWRAGVEALRDAGHEVRVLTTDYRSPDADPAAPDDPDARRDLRWYWRDHEFPRLSLRERLAIERHNARVLERELGEVHPAVVSWWAMGGMSLGLIERVRGSRTPAVGFVHDEWMLYAPKVDAWQRAVVRLGPVGPPLASMAGAPAVTDLGSAARWVFVSEAVRTRAAERWQLTDTAVAHSGVDLSLFGPAPERPEWGGRLLYVGRIDERKGIETAVRALEHLPGATLTVVGSGDEAYLGRLRALVRDTGAGDRVEFRDAAPREELPAVYAGADVVVFPVLWEEPWGLVPLEAMAVGVPVVATGRGGSGEFLRDGQNCLVYEPAEDPATLARAVTRLAEDRELRDRLRTEGQATANQHDQASFTRAVIEEHERAARRPATDDG